MVTARFKIAGRVLLAASVLLTGTAAPGICHAHEGGCQPHEHRAAKQHPHKHSHHGHSHTARDHRHARPVAPNNSAGLCTNCARHVHLSWLGLELTLPAESGDQESGFGSNASHEMIMVRSGDALAATTSTDHCFGTAFLLLFAAKTPDCSISALPRLDFSSTPIAMKSLCDAARHERSGVQLS